MGQLLLAAAEAEVANEKLDHILLSTTTVLPLVANDAESKQTAVISAPFIEFQR
jgi:hypothetical protein